MTTRHLLLMIAFCGAGGACADLTAQVLPQPGGMAVDASGRVLVAFTGRGTNSRTDLGVVVFDGAGQPLVSRRLAAGAAGATLGASGLLLDATAITVGGSNAGAGTQSDLVVTRFHHPPVVSGVEAAPAEDDLALAPAYPNPLRANAVAQLTFRTSAPSQVHVQVRDAAGRTVATLIDAHLPAGEHHAQVSLAEHPAGVYFVELRTDAGRRVGRLLKQ